MSQQHGDLFDMAFREAQKAWHSTPMLARTRAARAQDLVRVLDGQDASTVAKLLAEVAGPAFSAAAVTRGIDAHKASQLGEFIAHMALVDMGHSVAAGSGVAEAACDRLVKLQAHLRNWIAEGPTSPTCELGKANQLIGGQAETRLAIVAPLASALGVCLVVAQALASGYPLAGAAITSDEACQ